MKSHFNLHALQTIRSLLLSGIYHPLGLKDMDILGQAIEAALEESFLDGFQQALEASMEFEQAANHGQPILEH